MSRTRVELREVRLLPDCVRNILRDVSIESSVAGATVLIADDDRISRETLATLLRNQGYRIETVADGQEALERLGTSGISLIVADVLMPRMTGLDLCRIVRSMDGDQFIPVLLCSVKTDVDARVEGLRLGADDYIGKPFDERELLARVGALLRVKQQWDLVHEARARLEQLASHDELTGLYNYRHLNVRLAEEWKRAERYQEPLAAAMIDLDNFKVINDTLGHQVGDLALRTFAARLRRAVRDIDIIARYGGDEFTVLLPNTHLSGAITVADRLLREAVASSFTVGEENRAVNITASIGVAAYPTRDVRSKDALLRTADEALLAAKREGRNRIFVAAHRGYYYDPVRRVPAQPLPPGALRGPDGMGSSE